LLFSKITLYLIYLAVWELCEKRRQNFRHSWRLF